MYSAGIQVGFVTRLKKKRRQRMQAAIQAEQAPPILAPQQVGSILVVVRWNLSGVFPQSSRAWTVHEVD
ncbi:hypothetical protein RRG08_030277 [Elysia crispata]|uniref:Uncharacterized protein n=1 Tax=Elysia crispata TaxID=231223 RepID=A0AAE1AFR3_9GAST|nr:hypothetical protein RRG08_030277 [Elysia crispata]